MNEFYSIGEENQNPVDEFQLENLGKQTIMAIVGTPVRGDWGERSYQSKRFYKETKAEDYDQLFVSKLVHCRPPYLLSKIIDYHLKHYSSERNGDEQKFLQHIKYVILPIVKKEKDSEVTVGLIGEWFETRTHKSEKSPTNIKFGDINAPAQILVNSAHSNPRQNVTYAKGDIKEFLDLLQLDIVKLHDSSRIEFSSEIDKTIIQLQKNKDVRGRLLTLGEMMKDVGVGFFTNLVSSPVYDLLKPLLGL